MAITIYQFCSVPGTCQQCGIPLGKVMNDLCYGCENGETPVLIKGRKAPAKAKAKGKASSPTVRFFNG
jgi:hypothetical protein